MKNKLMTTILLLLALFASFVPKSAQALAIPPADFFQLPWELGGSWIAMSGLDNGNLREKSSPHNYLKGGAVDFAPHVGMKIGEDTSNAWVVAAATGRVVETSYCHIKLDHGNGWTTEYYHLGNIQVTKGAFVERNQRLAIIDNNANGEVCIGNRWPGPHLHFVLRPNMNGATFAGWLVSYDSKTNVTTFSKNGRSVGLFQPLLNEMGIVTPVPTTETPTVVPTTETPIPTTETPTVVPTTETPVPTTETPTVVPTTETPVPTTETPTVVPTTETPVPTAETPTVVPTTETPITPTLPTGLYVITVPTSTSIFVGDLSLVSVYLNNVPAEGLTSTEFTCSYHPSLLEVSNMADAGLFGMDAATAVNGPQNGTFIFAIAGSNGSRATSSGVAFTFVVKGLQVGQSVLECKARVSNGSGTLTDITAISAAITVNQPAPQTGTLMGVVYATKDVTVRLYDAAYQLAASVPANADGSFHVELPAGTYTVVTASADGFLSAQGTASITNGTTSVMPPVALLAGDIDGNDVIDQYDAMTIGMNYNTATPAAADLNNDGIINVLDLELLAANYRKSGALAWQ